MAMAKAVPFRLWLGGVVSDQRDMSLIKALVSIVHRCAASLDILVCVDGLKSYVKAFMKAFRVKILTGQKGRPRLLIAKGFLMGQGIEKYSKKRVVSFVGSFIRGTEEAIKAVLEATLGKEISTAYMKRLKAILMKWQERTLAMAAVLTDHRWTVWELLWLKIPIAEWVLPKRLGRHSKMTNQPSLELVA